jgi:hypothetical protein
MCHKAICKKCGKPTWKGCGNHIEEALAGVPKNQRCSCDKNASAANAPSGGFFSRLRSR